MRRLVLPITLASLVMFFFLDLCDCRRSGHPLPAPVDRSDTTGEIPTLATEIVWEEIVDESRHIKKPDPTHGQKPKRPILTWRFNTAVKRRRESSENVAPHPLRMDEYELCISWRDKALKRYVNETLVLQFSDNGFVRARNVGDVSKTLVGTWTLSPDGVSWELPVQTCIKKPTTKLLFFADMHLNPFGPQPKFTRGIILQGDLKRKRFRPVVGTFSGRGKGVDTADFSYQHRGFGLYKESSDAN